MKKTLIFILFVFILGILFITNDVMKQESFVSGQCPTTMIKNGEHIMVYNPKMAKIAGVNPIRLNDLEDYKEYVRWQKKNKLDCPILHLEKVFDTQGQEMYEIKPSFATDIPMGSLNHSMPTMPQDASRDNRLFNQNFLPGMDPYNQTPGVGSDKIILYPNSQTIEPHDYLRRK